MDDENKKKYQSPYKGFNSKALIVMLMTALGINPPIRGSIAIIQTTMGMGNCINPPIRGSIAAFLLPTWFLKCGVSIPL